jgi:hypothetical protein
MERLEGSKFIHARSFEPILDKTNDNQEKRPYQSLMEV